MRLLNVAVVGVGGQGVLTLGRMLGLALLEAGLDVTIAETHGLSQRGGSLIVHVRAGKGSAPLIPKGGAQVMLALEAIEAARYADYLARGGEAFVNEYVQPPPLSRSPGLAEIARSLKSLEAEINFFNANEVSRAAAGSTLYSNAALLGYAIARSKHLGSVLSLEIVESALSRGFSGRTLELNIRALRAGARGGL
ncbi:MAG: 2-oxoacid:acceptor oxidoreductase family protein [Desulfurococcaceae archaeon]